MTLICLVEGFISKKLLRRGSVKDIVSLAAFFWCISLTSSSWCWWEYWYWHFGDSAHQWWMWIVIPRQTIVNVLRVVASRPYPILLLNRSPARRWYKWKVILLLRLKLKVDSFDYLIFSLLTNITFKCFGDSSLRLSLQVTKICNGIKCGSA